MADLRRILQPDAACASAEAGSFLAQLDDQLRRLTEDTRGLTPDDLAWQAEPGINTIGMLLCHIAIVEVYWVQVGVLGGPTGSIPDALGIGEDDDGMPLPEGAGPPAALAGKDLAWFDGLLARARAQTRSVLEPLSDADLDREATYPRRAETGMVSVNMRWILYHVLEHLAGHYGQVNLLRHQRRLIAARGGVR